MCRLIPFNEILPHSMPKFAPAWPAGVLCSMPCRSQFAAGCKAVLRRVAGVVANIPCRHCERSEAIHAMRHSKKSWNCFVASPARNDGEIHVRDLAHSSAFSPELSREIWPAVRPLQSEGAGNAGRPMRPIAACAELVEYAHALSGHTGITRHSPRNGFTVYFVLSRVTGLFCHPRPRRLLSANLTPASGHQDHTTSPSASGARPSSAPPASTASRPAFVTLRNAPLSGAGRRGDMGDLGSGSRENSENQKLVRAPRRSARQSRAGATAPQFPCSISLTTTNCPSRNWTM